MNIHDLRSFSFASSHVCITFADFSIAATPTGWHKTTLGSDLRIWYRRIFETYSCTLLNRRLIPFSLVTTFVLLSVRLRGV